mmetsp:Transcript_26192/g.67679  ORF Transcript_26192/g.67679 Transcript_26192/m.67679 type:complete len:249 (+) Transcript_26192:536-1282(+)
MVLDLVVEPAVEHGEQRPAHVGRGLDLPLQEGRVPADCALWPNARDTLKVMRDEEEEGEIEAASHHRRADAHGRVHARRHPHRQRDEPRPEEKLEGHRRHEEVASELGDRLAFPPPAQQLDDVEEEQLERVHRLTRQQVQMLQPVHGLPAVRRLESQHAVRLLIRVVVDVVRVQVVHHDVLLQPQDHVPADPVLAQPEREVDCRRLGQSAVVGVVLNVEAYEREEPAEDDGGQQTLARVQHVRLERHG